MKATQGIFACSLFTAFASACLAQTPSWDKRTPLDEALDLYQQFSRKTVIRSSYLPSLSDFNKPIDSSDTNGMRIVLENELLNKGIEFIPHHEVFALAVPVGWSNSPAAQFLATLKTPPTDVAPVPKRSDETPANEAIPAGTIDLRSADLNQVLNLYEMLANRNILRGSQLSSPTFKLHTETPLPKSDAIYMMEVALALNGIASIEDGTNFIQVVPLTQVANLNLQAPQRRPGEPLLDARTVREFRFASPFDLVSYYAELTGRTALASNQVRGAAMLFRAQTRLTKPELLYALETTLALNGLAIIQVDDKTIRAGYIHELKKTEKKS